MRTDSEQKDLILEKIKNEKKRRENRIFMGISSSLLVFALLFSSFIFVPKMFSDKNDATDDYITAGEEADSKIEAKDGKTAGYDYYYSMSGDPSVISKKNGIPVPTEDYPFVYGEGEDIPRGAPDDSEGKVLTEEKMPDKSTEYVPSQRNLTGAELYDLLYYREFLNVFNGKNWDALSKKFILRADKRIVVRVNCNDGSSLVSREGIRATLVSEEGKVLYSSLTDNTGSAYLFTNAFGDSEKPASIVLSFKNDRISETLTDGKTEYTFDMDPECFYESENKLDVRFVIDTTGSMGDELAYLKREISNIITEVGTGSLNVYTGLTFYRDEGDEYVVRNHPLTSDLDEVYSNIQKEYASGGGDYPEAVHSALEKAINSQDWRSNSTKLLFIVLDAPPHADLASVVESIMSSVKRATELGIRIIPIVASGSDDVTEYFMRQMSVLTGGTYTFLTDDSGIGNAHSAPTTDVSFKVENLKDMIVRIINRYTASASDFSDYLPPVNTEESDS